MHIFKHTNFDFLRWRWHAIALSWIIIIAGVIALATKGIPKGVEFAGGTVVIERFDKPTSVQQVREALDRNYPGGGQNTVVQSYGEPSANMVMIRVPQVGSESGASLSTEAQKVEDALNQIINVSVNQTLGRTVITSGTALLTALALFFFGGEVLHGFAFTMVVGIITGTYSSVFIAAAIVSLWRGDAPTRAAAHAHVIAPAAPAPQQPQRKQKPQRKARAS